MYLPDAREDQKRAADPMDLESQTSVGCHVGAGNQGRVLCKGSQ